MGKMLDTKRYSHDKQSGFTIVELLIVIVIIAVLAAISVVGFNGIQNRAKTASGQTTARNVQKKVQLYGALGGSDNTPDLSMLNSFPETRLDPNTVVDVWASGVGSAGINQASTYANGKKIIYAPDAGGACAFWWDYTANAPRSLVAYGSANCNNWL